MKESNSILSRKVNWAKLALEHIQGVERECDFFLLKQRVHYRKVQPNTFLLYEQDGCVQVILNLFQKKEYDNFAQEGRSSANKAHYHHHSFTTRILNGSYLHWVYENSGDLARPNLTPKVYAKCTVGTVYTMFKNDFHSVLSPQDNTLSLMVRCGINPIQPIDIEYTRGTFEADWALVKLVLHKAAMSDLTMIPADQSVLHDQQ
jgi:hypothetical protein